MLIPFVITLSVILAYTVFIGVLLSGFTRLNKPVRARPAAYEKVSVVVPFRNEAANLPLIIEDLQRQSWPGDLLTVILVNDHSTDDSFEIANRMIMKIPGYICLDLPRDVSGKKAALYHAVSNATTRWIIQIDADCRVGPDFIRAHMTFLEECPSDLVAGMVTTRSGKGSFLEGFERLDLLGLTGAGAGSFYYGHPLMCSGANLLYTRELYMETRQFDPVDKSASGDDMFLLIGARKLGRKISFNRDRLALALTGQVADLKTLIRQRIRWGAKSVYYRMGDIQVLALLAVLADLLVLVLPVWMILFQGSYKWFLPVFGIKTAVDFLLILVTAGTTGQRSTLGWFLPAALFYYPFMLVVIAGSLLGRSSWK
jgi:biofilm PGA synthesis N-glycosyltransferase PgaC